MGTTVIQVVYTFTFGLCISFTLQVTGQLIWPILLHATTDLGVFPQSAYSAAVSNRRPTGR